MVGMFGTKVPAGPDRLLTSSTGIARDDFGPGAGEDLSYSWRQTERGRLQSRMVLPPSGQEET